VNPSLENLANAARERPVPWSAERSARVERRITRGRERSPLAAPAARFALGGLASAALFACLVHLSNVHRDALSLERDLAGTISSAPVSSGPVSSDTVPSGAGPSGAGPREETSRVVTPETEPADGDRPVGDGGFTDNGQ
jgi:hypothetical protein